MPRGALPRIRRSDLLELVGVSELSPADGPPDRLLEATLAATALAGLAGSGEEVCAARRALVNLAGGRIPVSALATWIGVSRRTLFRLRANSADPNLQSAIRLQLGLLARLPAASLSPEIAIGERVSRRTGDGRASALDGAQAMWRSRRGR